MKEYYDGEVVIGACRDAGLQVYREDHLEANDGRTGREFGVVDFDGNLIVLYHITGSL